MSDKTEWFTKERNDGWDVLRPGRRGNTTVARNLDKSTADKIAAVNELEAALEACLAREKQRAALAGFSDCGCMMLSRESEIEYETGTCPHQKGHAALAKSRGET